MGHAFEDKDLDLLGKSMKLRERMMDNIAKKADGDLPVKPSDLMAVTNLLESVDRSIYAKAKINIEDSSSKNEEATREVLRGLMVDLHNQRALGPVANAMVAQIPGYQSRTEVSVSAGELITKSDNYSPED
jgi:hypothetical protein